MMSEFEHTITCSRPATTAAKDRFNNDVCETRPVVTFEAVFMPPNTATGSQIVDGALRETTITKPTLMVDRRETNAPALVAGAIKSGDHIIVNGVPGYQVDGDPADLLHPWTGWTPPLVIELRRTSG